MSDSFDPASFRPVTLSDHALLENRLTRSLDQSCEFNFANLYMWGEVFGGKWALWHDHLFLSMTDEGESFRVLMFASDPVAGEPSPAELLAVSDGVRTLGQCGSFQHVRPEYVERHPELTAYFDPAPMDAEFDEYVYEVETLAELKGAKLAKKRNLIAQFKRDNPEFSVCPITAALIPKCLALADRWRTEYPDSASPYLEQEHSALRRMLDHYDELDLIGLAGYVRTDMVSFEICSRVNADVYTEHFEKALHEYKGATQFINNETAKLLRGRCRLLNREQDLGSPGLRQAKLSYEPLFLLRNYILTRKS